MNYDEISEDTKDLSDPSVFFVFYQRIFPFKYIFQWLNRSPIPSKSFFNREIAFTLQNDAYLRYNSFPTYEAFRKEVLRLNPSRFEIGPIYNANPRDRKTFRRFILKPLEKELVFDIDLTDYDDVRTCCSKTDICLKCWGFITASIKVIDSALREDFGFEYILWVYSGRRGVHAWVCDKKARELNDQKRKAIATYLEVPRGGVEYGRKVEFKRPLHPSISRSLHILKESFRSNILISQNPWESDEGSEKLLEFITDQDLKETLREKWKSQPMRSSYNKWHDIDIVAESGVSKNLDTKALLTAKQDIILEYMYPRLDTEVSKHLSHLLKSPFCVHPGTGRICVPIDSSCFEKFNPFEVPTVTQLLDEIDAWDKEHKENLEMSEKQEQIQDYEKTSLKPYIEYFKKFTSLIMKEEAINKRELDKSEGSVMLDF
ncbi:hypothetical protein T552_00202 [Pneumocystis carinii B80]|uniref:DNA primase n=1 Tax=Pneumocystis carinii (strain B80) TaxID=1408658 RepID=A0A0W4ZT63_PNEC8|nr:hypothetical protein T552_00202 [Pneumocystis carinii B80]KTW31564.1 hypothetical protein T552_00202 [Pneumocystis carinii B80]